MASSTVDPTTLADRLIVLLCIYSFLLIIGLFGFNYVRNWLPWFYYAHRLVEKKDEEADGSTSSSQPNEPLIAAKTPYSPSRFGWMGYVWKANELDEAEEGSFVGASYLVLMRHASFYVTWLMAISIALILPLNVYGGHETNGIPDNKGFIRTTLSNIVDDPASYLWGHVIVQFAQSFVLVGVMIGLFRSVFDIDVNFQQKGRVEFHTVKLRHLPSAMTEQKLMAKLEKYFPDDIIGVHFAYSLDHITKLKKKYQQFVDRLEDVTFEENHKGTTKYIRVQEISKKTSSDQEDLRNETGITKPTTKQASKWLFWKGKKVPEASFLQENINWLQYKIEKFQMEHVNNAYHHNGIAYVTFKDATTALAFANKETILKKVQQIDGQNYQSSLPEVAITSITGASNNNKREPLLNKLKGVSVAVSGMNRKMAVSPEEILWENLGATRREQTSRAIVTSFLTVLIALLWAIPIAILSSFNALAQLPVVGPLFSKIQTNHPQGSAFVESILSPLLAIISEQLVRGILTKLAAMEKPHSRAGLEASFQKKYFIFILFNIFLFQTVFVSGLDVIAKLSEENGTVWEAISAINWTYSGAFFINYLLQKAFIGFLFSLFRVTAVFGAVIKKFRAKTDRQKRKAQELTFFRYSVYFGKIAIYIAIATMFSTVVPLVTGAAFLLFLLRYWSDKHNILLALPKYDSTAIRCVRLGFYFVFISVFMAQLFLFNYFVVLEPKSGYMLVFPLINSIICLIALNYAFNYQKKNSRPKHLLNCESKEDLPNAYLHPALLPMNVELTSEIKYD